MENIKCLSCGTIAVKRKGSKFCCSKCKDDFWNRKKSVYTNLSTVNTEENYYNNTSTPESHIEIPQKTIKVKTLVKNPLLNLLDKEINNLKQVERALVTILNNELVHLNEKIKASEMDVKKLTDQEPGSFSNLLVMFPAGISEAIHHYTRVKNYKDIYKLRTADTRLKLQSIRSEILNFDEIRKNAPSEIVQIKTVENPKYRLYLDEQEQIKADIENKKIRAQIDEKTAHEIKERRIREIENPVNEKAACNDNLNQSQEINSETHKPSTIRITTAKELSQMNFQSLRFGGIWDEFLGSPSIDFSMIIHGQPGAGKSTFCVLLAEYLSLKFGTVIYIAGEEGFSLSLKEKLNRVNTNNQNFFFADIPRYDLIESTIKKDQFNFMIIDSLNYFKITPDNLKNLRTVYPNTALISIAQSTKEGHMRGSHEIIHDCDIEIYVGNGIAITRKNRFKKTGQSYQIFN